MAGILGLSKLDNKIAECGESLLAYTAGLRLCFTDAESENRMFIELRNNVIGDSCIFGKMVIPVSIVVMKEVYMMIDLLSDCETPEDFASMGTTFSAQCK